MSGPVLRVLVAAAWLAGCVAGEHAAGTQTVGARGADGAQASPLLIQPVRLDMGEVTEGQSARARLLVRNVSKFPVHIARVETSCGCTTTHLERRDLQPGEFAALDVRVDASLKRGAVRKTVTVVEAGGGRATATLLLTVRPDPHATMKSASLFSGRCARCHAEPARGKRKGAAIYAAVCGMCHGPGAEGGYAPRLAGLPAGVVRDALTQGAGPAMPAFAKRSGGPLDEAQIAALADWLSGLDAGGRLR